MNQIATDDPIERLRAIWAQATADTIGRDMALAREIAEEVPPDRRSEADEFLKAMLRLERWLRDL